MSDMTRRTLLRSALGAMSVGVGLAVPREASAQWGTIPPGLWPMAYQPKKILEIFCYSGLSQWENFWVSEDVANVKNWRNFQPEVTALNWHSCTGVPSPSTEVLEFGTDAVATGNKKVFWGPSTKPLWRPDIFGRARMVTISHIFQPHEAATPLGLTGRRLGNPRLAGLGATIQHRQMSLAPRVIPYSFVLIPSDIGIFSFVGPPATSTGQHPGFSQPMLIKIGDATFQTQLQRQQMTPQADNLFKVYQAQYRDLLRWHGGGDPVRSAGFKSYDSAANFLVNASQLDTLLGGGVLNVGTGRICGTEAAVEPPQVSNKTKTALEVATLLLTQGDAYHVCVFDRGLVAANADSPYDTHNPYKHVEVTSTNLFNLLSHLAGHIDPTPGADPNKINLDTTMIVINTEFTRTPNKSGSGRDHWPDGFVSVLIGGPITSRGIAGGLNSSSLVVGGTDFSPTDVYGAVLLAAGIDPFEPENFGVAEFTANVNDGTEGGTRTNLKQKVLGVP